MRDKTASSVAGPECGARAKESIMPLHAAARGAYDIPRLTRIGNAATALVHRIGGSGTLLARFVAALHESRRREAQRVLRRYSHLIDKSEN